MPDHEGDLIVANHEAGHAVMSYLLGVTPGLTTIVSGPNYGGCSAHGRVGMPQVTAADLEVPIIEMRAMVRRGLERTICILLAGKAAERLVPAEPHTGYVAPDPDLERASRLAELAVPDRREAARLALWERDGIGGDGDQGFAERLAHGAAGDTLMWAYLHFLQAVVDELVTSPRFRGLVDALVPQLLAHRTLSGRAVRAVLIEADKEGRRRPSHPVRRSVYASLMPTLAAFPSMMQRDRKREGLRICRAAWLVGVTVREYREMEAGDRVPDNDVWDRTCKLYGWPQSFAQ